MNETSWPELANRLGKWGAVIACVVLLSLLWSFIAPRLIQLLINSAKTLREETHRRGAALVDWFRERYERFIAARRREPRRPTLIALEGVRGLIEAPLESALGDIRDLERDLHRTSDLTARLTPGASLTAGAGDRGAISAEAMTASPWGVIGTLAAAALIGAFNATLLNIFFGELFGSVRLLPYPLPNLQLSLALGIIFFLLEIFVGHLLGRAHTGGDGSRTSAFMQGFVPWFGLVVLAAVETAAYALLSKQIDLAARLSLDPAGPLYGLATYFLAFLGAGITLILAGLGYEASKQWDRYRATRVERAVYRAMQASASAAASHEERLEDVEAALKRVQEAVHGLPRDIGKRANEALGGSDDQRSLLTSIGDLMKQLLPSESSSPTPFVRTASQVFAELGLQVFLGVITVFAFSAMVSLYTQLLQGAGSRLALASVISLGVLGLGFLLRDSHTGGRRGSVVRVVASTASVRSMWSLAALLGLLVLGVVSGLSAMHVQLLGNSPWLNFMLGAGITLVLGLLGGVLDLLVTGVLDTLLLTWTAISWILGRLIQMFGVALAFLLDVCRFVAELLTVPGGWLRRGVAHG